MTTPRTWLLLALLCLFAGARWLTMSTPDNFEPWLPVAWFEGDALGMTRIALNVGCSALFLVALPLLFLRRFTDHGVGDLLAARAPRLDRRSRLLAIAVVAGALMIGVAAPRMLSGVREAYPLNWAAGASVGTLVVSELLVILLILATELFYRGIALSLLSDRMRGAAIYVVAIIYALDHIGAPTAEVIGSFFAGIMLGYLAVKTRSIWPGFVAHAACAVMVDMTSLWLEGKP